MREGAFRGLFGFGNPPRVCKQGYGSTASRRPMETLTKVPKTGSPKSEKGTRPLRPRNRYVVNAKLSEYRFLKVLRTFVDWKTPSEAVQATGISERTIRGLFDKLRQAIIDISLEDRTKFGGLGFFLYQGDELSVRGRVFMTALQGEDSYRGYLLRYGARPNDNHACMLLLWERAARMHCIIGASMFELAQKDDALPDAVRQERLRVWRKKYGIRDHHSGEVKPDWTEFEQQEHLSEKLHAHRRPDLVMYHDLRRALMKRPLC